MTLLLCPKCGAETRVLDTRSGAEGSYLRRRRMCVSCKFRVTTLETISIAKMDLSGEAKKVTASIDSALLGLGHLKSRLQRIANGAGE